MSGGVAHPAGLQHRRVEDIPELQATGSECSLIVHKGHTHCSQHQVNTDSQAEAEHAYMNYGLYIYFGLSSVLHGLLCRRP